MHILAIVNTFPPVFGGVGEYTNYLLQTLHGYGHEVSVICEYHPAIQSTSWCNVFPIVSNWNSRKDIKKCIAIVHKQKPSIVLLEYDGFAYHKYGFPLSLAYLIFKLNKVSKTIVFYHEVRNKFKRFGLLRFINLSIQIITIQLIHFLSDLSITSTPLYQKLIQYPFLKNKPVELIRIGSNVVIKNTPPNLGLKEKLGLNNHFVLGTFGHKPRSILFILHSLPLIIQNHPDVKLLIIGKFRPDILQMIKDEIGKLQINDYVLMTGYLPASDVYDYLKLIDIYLMLENLHEEGIWTGTSTRSGSLAAAFGTGLATIGTKGEKTDDFFNKKNILLIEELNPKVLAETITKLKADTILLNTLKQHARQSFLSELSWEVIAKKTEDFCFNLLKDNK